MRRLAVILTAICAVSLFGLAHAQNVWQDFQNTGGFTEPVTSSCFLYASAAFDVQCYTPSTGLTLGASALTVDLSMGVPGGQAVIGGTGTTDSLTVQATNATPASGAKIYLQTKFGNDYYDPVVHTLGLGIGPNPVSMFAAGTQLIAKSGGDLQLGTVDAHGVEIVTNGLTAVEVDSTQHVVLPSLGGGGTQCMQFDNTGELAGTGAPCSSGSGGVTNVTASPPLFSSGGATPNMTEQGAIVSGSTSTTAQNIGALTSGVMEEAVSAGVATVSTFASTPGEVQFGAASAGGLANDSALFWDNTNKRLGIGTASPSVSFQDQATVNGDLMGGIVNASTGTGARSLWAFGSVAFANPSLTLLVDGVNYAASGGLYTAGSSIWYYNASATSHLLFQNQSGDTIWTTGASPVGGAVKLGITNAGHVEVADLSAGGMVKTTATTMDGFSVGQLAQAAAGTDYAPVGSCATHSFVTATNASTLTCLQPALGDLQSIAAHTIVANGTALAAAPAQTSIGTTLAFDGTSQLQCVGLLDGAGVGFTTTGQTWAAGGLLTALAGNHIGTNTIAAISSSIELSKLAYFVAGGIPAAATWIATSSSSFVSTSSLEYPNDFLAGHVFAEANYFGSVGAGTLNCEVTRNGTGISGTVLTFTLGTFGVHASPVTATGSASANDTYGVICQASSGAGATVNFTFKAVLIP